MKDDFNTLPSEIKSARKSSERLRSDRLEPGTLIAGRYRVLSQVGQGGMGCVYQVTQVYLKNDFALKTLPSEYLDARAILRFQKEAQAASLLDHPGLVKVHDFGIWQSMPYLVMDFVPGKSLDSILQFGPLSVDEALDVFIQIAFALNYAHEKGIVHRDLKPANIMVELEIGGRMLVKILDFGIAKVLSESENALTKTGEVVGSPSYMSPEQCIGGAIDQRTDIYSIGCVLFECLTGSPPFVANKALATMMKHRHEEPPSLKEASLGLEFSADMERIVAQLLEKDPSRRYQNCLNLAADLNRLQTGRKLDFAPVESAKPALSLPGKGLLISLAGMVMCSLGGFLLGASHNASVTNQVVQSLNIVSTASAAGNKATNKVETSPYCTSVINGGRSRHFYFPRYIGQLLLPLELSSMRFQHNGEGSFCNSVSALGDVRVENFEPLKFMVDEKTPHDSGVLDGFKNDQLCALAFAPDLKNHEVLQALQNHPEIVGLELNSANLNAADFAAINSVPHLSKLDVSGSTATAEDLVDLKRLRELSSFACSGIHSVNRVLGAMTSAKNLQTLRINECGLSDADLSLIGNMQHLRSLSACSNERLTLNSATVLKNLRELYYCELSGCTNISGFDFSSLQKVRRLNLTGCNLSDADLAKVAAMPNLEQLNLCMNPLLSDVGVRQLSHSSRLTKLILDYCPKITEKSVTSFNGMPSLRQLSLKNDWTLELQSEFRKELNVRVKATLGGGNSQITELLR